MANAIETNRGFATTIAPEMARRQFHLSVALVVLMGVGATTVAFMAGPKPGRTVARDGSVTQVVQAPQRVHSLQAGAGLPRVGG